MTETEKKKDYFSPKEAAPILMVSYWTVLRMIKRHELKIVAIGERYHIPRAEIEQKLRPIAYSR